MTYHSVLTAVLYIIHIVEISQKITYIMIPFRLEHIISWSFHFHLILIIFHITVGINGEIEESIKI